MHASSSSHCEPKVWMENWFRSRAYLRVGRCLDGHESSLLTGNLTWMDCLLLSSQVVVECLNKFFPESGRLHVDEINRAHRLGSSRDGKPRSIIAQLCQYESKVKLIKNRRCLKGSSVVVKEDLTQYNQKLLVMLSKNDGRYVTVATLDEVDKLPIELLAKHRYLGVKFFTNRAVTHEIVRVNDTFLQMLNFQTPWFSSGPTLCYFTCCIFCGII